MRLPRFIRRWYAEAFGYFWIPCPVCGEEFGGFEEKGFCVWDEGSGPRYGTGKCICPLHDTNFMRQDGQLVPVASVWSSAEWDKKANEYREKWKAKIGGQGGSVR